MREILFRGQTRKKGQQVMMGTGEEVPGHWVYGGIFPGTGDYSIIYGGETEKDLEKHYIGLAVPQSMVIEMGNTIWHGFMKKQSE